MSWNGQNQGNNMIGFSVKIVVVGTYLKRKKNLVLTQYASDGNLLTMEDLRQSLAESCDSLKLCRIRAAYYVENVDVQMNADDY